MEALRFATNYERLAAPAFIRLPSSPGLGFIPRPAYHGSDPEGRFDPAGHSSPFGTQAGVLVGVIRPEARSSAFHNGTSGALTRLYLETVNPLRKSVKPRSYSGNWLFSVYVMT